MADTQKVLSGVPNSEREYLIDEWIHNKRNRKIMKLHFIDGLSPNEIAKDKDILIEPRQISNVIEKCCESLSTHL